MKIKIETQLPTEIHFHFNNIVYKTTDIYRHTESLTQDMFINGYIGVRNNYITKTQWLTDVDRSQTERSSGKLYITILQRHSYL